MCVRRPIQCQWGLSLIELMIALSIGLVLSGAVLTVFVNATRSLNAVERYAQMQENGRFALRVLREDLMMTDFWARVTSTDTIDNSKVEISNGDCGEAIFLYDASTGLLGNDNHDEDATKQFSVCSDIGDVRRSNSDVIAIKRVSGTATDTPVEDTVYVRSNGTTAWFLSDADTSSPDPGYSDWEYKPRIYFIRRFYESDGDNTPALCRRELDGLTLSKTVCVAAGIEDLRVQYGIDSDGDAVPDFYTASPLADQMKTVIAARVYLLARSVDTDPQYTDFKTYVLGDQIIGPFDDPEEQRYYRSVLSSTILLRNSAALSLLE